MRRCWHRTAATNSAGRSPSHCGTKDPPRSGVARRASRTPDRAISSRNRAGSAAPARPAWQFGRAEVTGPERRGAVAWGESAAAAERAAELLGQSGLRTTVVNARFLHPLDARRSRPRPAGSGFAWCSTTRTAKVRLRGRRAGTAGRAGVTTPTSVQSLQRHRRALDVLERARPAGWGDCRSLSLAGRAAEPDLRRSPVGTGRAMPACAAATSGWLQIFGARGRRRAGNGKRPRRSRPAAPSLPPADAPNRCNRTRPSSPPNSGRSAAVQFSPDLRVGFASTRWWETATYICGGGACTDCG